MSYFYKDVIGQKFNRLTVIERSVERDSAGSILWKCRCDCGNTRLVASKSLKRGDVKSCGCLHSEYLESLFRDVSGQRFGKLVATKYLGKIGKFPMWECICDCGSIYSCSVYNLQHGRITSCGCRFHKTRLLSDKEASFNKLYCSYRRNAKTRNLEFSLSEGEFRELTSQNCYYCGLEPSQYSHRTKGNMNGIYVYSGIDRIDNSKGYILDNCVPCCWICNLAKRDMSVGNFYVWIERVYKFSHSRGVVSETKKNYNTEIGTMEHIYG